MAQINESDIKTPGVYVNEIPSFPPSIAQVATAIPAFIGYTEFAEQNGHDLTMVPTKISSLLEYITYFGGMHEIIPGEIKVTIDPANKNAVKNITVNKQFYLYNSIRSFYDNGGGNCYIVSVGKYNANVEVGDEDDSTNPGLRSGIKAVEKYDEPTILLFPDAVLLSENQFYSLQQMALKQCAALGDRVCILDLQENHSGEWSDNVKTFRENIGINNLNYGNAYTPWLVTAISKKIPFAVIDGSVVDTGENVLKLESLTVNPAVNELVLNVMANSADAASASKLGKDPLDAKVALGDTYNKLINGLLTASGNDKIKEAAQELTTFIKGTIDRVLGLKSTIQNPKFVADLSVLYKADPNGLIDYMTKLVALSKNAHVTKAVNLAAVHFGDLSWLTSVKVDDTEGSKELYPEITGDIKAPLSTSLGFIMNGIIKVITSIQSSATQYNNIAEQVLYQSHPIINNIVSKIQQKLSTLPPSGTVAGVYATVDGTRGVWKAPANVSLNGIVAPTQVIDDNLQKDLNIDTDAGKSINAIRAFTGKGILVWGARTLDGNSNDWRYISVRRFYIMVEESVKKATMQFVFEPNDANTWVRVRAMIENYLTNLWRLGALAGAKPEHAFYVKVGLGQTMTFDDILNGKMIVEIGMAPVRPAEFIILRFSQIQQQS